MNSALLWGDAAAEPAKGEEANFVEARMLRSRLVNLTLDWELAALSLDARRYRAMAADERESLRDSATVYRKCISELSALISAGSLVAQKLKTG